MKACLINLSADLSCQNLYKYLQIRINMRHRCTQPLLQLYNTCIVSSALIQTWSHLWSVHVKSVYLLIVLLSTFVVFLIHCNFFNNHNFIDLVKSKTVIESNNYTYVSHCTHPIWHLFVHNITRRICSF